MHPKQVYIRDKRHGLKDSHTKQIYGQRETYIYNGRQVLSESLQKSVFTEDTV